MYKSLNPIPPGPPPHSPLYPWNWGTPWGGRNLVPGSSSFFRARGWKPSRIRIPLNIGCFMTGSLFHGLWNNHHFSLCCKKNLPVHTRHTTRVCFIAQYVFWEWISIENVSPTPQKVEDLQVFASQKSDRNLIRKGSSANHSFNFTQGQAC